LHEEGPPVRGRVRQKRGEEGWRSARVEGGPPEADDQCEPQEPELHESELQPPPPPIGRAELMLKPER